MCNLELISNDYDWFIIMLLPSVGILAQPYFGCLNQLIKKNINSSLVELGPDIVYKGSINVVVTMSQ